MYRNFGSFILGRTVAGWRRSPNQPISSTSCQLRFGCCLMKFGSLGLPFQRDGLASPIRSVPNNQGTGQPDWVPPVSSCAPDCEIGFSESGNRANNSAGDFANQTAILNLITFSQLLSAHLISNCRGRIDSKKISPAMGERGWSDSRFVSDSARWLLVGSETRSVPFQTIHPAGGQVQYRLRALLDTEAETDTGAHTDS